MSGWTFAHYIMCIITSVVMTSNGFGARTWQWWVICACQIASFICGREHGEKKE